MAISNSTSFTQDRDQVISDTLITLGVYRPGGTIDTNDYTICANWLNKIIKELAKRGIHMWTQTEGTLFLTNNISTYNIGDGGNIAGDNTVESQLTVAASGTTVTIASTVGMNINDNIGICLDNNTIQWTTISSIPSTVSVNLNATVSSSASIGNWVFVYTNAASKPLNITSAVIRDTSSTDKPLYIRDRDEFLRIPNKTQTQDSINQIFYNSNRDDGLILTWPTPANCAYRIKYLYNRTIYDYTQSTDNTDLPSEWLNCLTLLLMSAVSGVYQKSFQERAALKQDAERCLQEMQLTDINGGSLRITPAPRDDY